MLENFNFDNSEMWDCCSEIHKKTLLCPNIFGHVLLENKNNILNLNEIDDVIETGTYDARSSIFFAHLFKNVHTIELYEDINPYSNQSFKKLYDDIKIRHPNINFYFGNSPEVLKNILLLNKNKRFLFLLDAHTANFSPLLEELRAIFEFSDIKNHVIIIDDCNFLGSHGYPSKQQFLNEIKKINNLYSVVETNHGNKIFLVH